ALCRRSCTPSPRLRKIDTLPQPAYGEQGSSLRFPSLSTHATCGTRVAFPLSANLTLRTPELRAPNSRHVSADALNREIAYAGQRVKQKVTFARTVASVIPLLILTYAFQAPVRQILAPIGQYTEAFTMPALLIFTGLLMAGGGFVVWDVASAISRAAHLPPPPKVPRLPPGPAGQDEVGAPVGSVGERGGAIEAQDG